MPVFTTKYVSRHIKRARLSVLWFYFVVRLFYMICITTHWHQHLNWLFVHTVNMLILFMVLIVFFLINFNFTQTEVVFYSWRRLDHQLYRASSGVRWALKQNDVTTFCHRARIESTAVGLTTITVSYVQIYQTTACKMKSV